jgi:ELWxxDGT repeat protein
MYNTLRNILCFILTIIVFTNVNGQTAGFIEGIKNNWTFFRDRIIYADNNAIYYRLNGDTKLYYSDGTAAGTKATSYTFGADAFFSPDLGVFAHDNNYTALGTDDDPHDIIIFKDKSPAFDYVEKAAKSFKGMTFLNGKLYYIFSKTGSVADKLVEYDPVSKTKKELMSFTTDGAFGICAFKDKLLIVGYFSGNKLISFEPSTGSMTVLHTFNTTNTFAKAINMMPSGDNVYFWYPNGSSKYSLFVSKGAPSTTIALMDNLTAYDEFTYYTSNIVKAAEGKLMAKINTTGDTNTEFTLYSDGTVQGTKLLEYNNVKLSGSTDFVYYCKQFFFIASDGSGSYKLFSTNGTNEGTKKLSDIPVRELVLFNNRLYLSDGNTNQGELFAWNDKNGKIEFVLDVNDAARQSEPREFRTIKDKLFMVAVRSNLDLSYKLAVMTEPFRTKEDCSISASSDGYISGYSVFPNPFTTEITINAENQLSSTTQVVISDISGRIIVQKSVEQFPAHINTYDWQSGVYFVRLISAGKKSETVRILRD